MATFLTDTLNEYLTCGICDSLCDDPATLQCGHTYCRKCLTSLLESLPDSIRDKAVPCAKRCEGTQVPNPQTPIDDWARQIKPSLIITNLLNDLKQMTAQAATMEQRKKQFSPCAVHEDELVNMICENCKEAICSMCSDIKHQQCASVVPMETKVMNIKPELLNYKLKLKNMIQLHNGNITKFRSKEKEIREIQRETQSKIGEAFLIIADVLKAKETSLLRELESLTESEVQLNKEMIQTEEGSIQIYQQRSQQIEGVEKSGLLSAMYNIYQSYLSPESSERDICQSTYSPNCIQFSVNTDQLVDSLNKLDFGKIDVRYKTSTVEETCKTLVPESIELCCPSNDMTSASADVTDQITKKANENAMTDGLLDVREQPIYTRPKLFRSPVLADTIQCKVPGDSNEPYICDVTVLDVEGLNTCVVTDNANYCVKSFYIRINERHHSTLHLDHQPSCIAQWKENQVMVAVPGSRKIITVEVNPDLVLLSTIRTKRKYVGIAVPDLSHLAAGSTGSNVVDILNLEGQVMKSVFAHNNVKLFSNPLYLFVDCKGNLLVSDIAKCTVTCLTPGGKFEWVYDQSLQYPTGIQWTQEGILLVNFNKVILLTETGEYVRDVLTEQEDLQDPQGICVDEDNSLFVCCGTKVKHFTFT